MISVIIPVFNAEKSIEKTLASVKNQTWKGRFEIIMVNDGSTDGSVGVIENFKHKNPEMDITLVHQENLGVSSARNAAMKLAKGQFIALLDADDEWLPEKTARQMHFLTDSARNIDFLACARLNQPLLYPYRVGEKGLAEITFRKLMLRNEAPTPTVIFKVKVLQNTGFYIEDQRYAEDLNYWLRISENNSMFILNEGLVIAGDGKRSFGVSGLSANLSEMEKGFQQNLKQMLNSKRINQLEYVCYFVFYKFKYILRLIRNQYLKMLAR